MLSSPRAVVVDREGSSCRHLAARVIQQAFRDLAGPAGSRCDYESARFFLAGSSMLHHWCTVANLDPARMVARAQQLTAPDSRRVIEGKRAKH
jgi:hypothetical protein